MCVVACAVARTNQPCILTYRVFRPPLLLFPSSAQEQEKASGNPSGGAGGEYVCRDKSCVRPGVVVVVVVVLIAWWWSLLSGVD